MSGCKAALNIKGEHFPCDNSAPHDGWAHSNRGAEAIWAAPESATRAVPANTLALNILAAKVARLRTLVETWEADERDHLNTFGQHLMGGAVASCAEQVTAILNDDSNPYEAKS